MGSSKPIGRAAKELSAAEPSWEVGASAATQETPSARVPPPPKAPREGRGALLFVRGPLELLSAMEKKQSRYQGLGWRLARERIGQLVRENYPVNQEMSPRLAEFIKKIENGSAEFSTEMFQLPGEKQDD
jgi:hypothetical protein